ncbi:MAG: tyrosine-type recombinase/integrase, partial [Myxococcales bacterium]|nr:tyrosine-type recombinase/integrase [Myxococcales bacterium]
FGLRFRVEGTELFSWSVPVHSRWVAYSSRDLAEGVLGEIRADVRRGMDPLAAISPYVRSAVIYGFGRFWEQWTATQVDRANAGEISMKRARVVGRYEQCGYLDPVLDVSVFSLDYGHMEDLKTHLLGKVGPKTTQNVLADVRTCLRRLARRRGMPRPPDIPAVSVPQHTPVIPSLDEQRKLLAAIPWEIRGYWLARGLLGVRDEEAARALLSDYRRGPDAGSDEWLIRAKGGRDRLLPVPAELARWVRENRPKLAPAGSMLFINPLAEIQANPGQRWLQDARRMVFHAAAKSIGCTGKWKPNEALRHCFGTRAAERLLREGVSNVDAIRMVMSIMGHTSAETSARYVRLGAECLRGVLGDDS